MPELPEVESITRILQGCVCGKTIESVKIFFSGMLGKLSPGEFAGQICGSEILEVKRRGKYLHFHLTGDKVLEVHLRMTGAFFYFCRKTAADKYTRAIFYLQEGGELHFRDIRKFGTFRIWDREKLEEYNRKRLGPDPLEDIHDLYAFQRLLKLRPRSCVKAFLLDQKNLAGMGNIYTDEALFRAGLHPSRRVETLTHVEQGKLLQALHDVLREGIECGGVSVSDYQDPYGRQGEFQQRLNVYRRENEPCPRCGEPVARRVVAGRGTYFCPVCQIDESTLPEEIDQP